MYESTVYPTAEEATQAADHAEANDPNFYRYTFTAVENGFVVIRDDEEED